MQSCSIHRSLWEEVALMRTQGIEAKKVLRQTTIGPAEQGQRSQEEARKQLQATLTKEIQKKEAFDPHYRIRAKLARWKLPETPGDTGGPLQAIPAPTQRSGDGKSPIGDP